MGNLSRLGQQLDEAQRKATWNEVLRACDNNEGLAYVVHGTLEGIAAKKSPNKAFSDAVENENFYGSRPDIAKARERAQEILDEKFGVQVAYVGEAIQEAKAPGANARAVRQVQVLPTENKEWGFYGTVFMAAPDDVDDHAGFTEQAWRAAFAALAAAFPAIPPAFIREFLDSRGGRYLADAVLTDQATISKIQRALREYLPSKGGSWVGKELAKMAGVESEGAQAGSAAIQAQVQAVQKALDAVVAEEAKKNWKQRDEAMHGVERAADALLTAVRAWFANRR